MTRVVAVLSLVLMAAPAAAQSRVELFGSFAVPARVVTGTFTSDYEPLLINGGTATGRAGQALQLQGGRPKGLLAGVNWLPGRRLGVQLFASRASHPIGGANVPNQVRLTYLTRQPPDYIEREFTYQQSVDWPDTEGTFTLWRLGANGLVRLGGERVDLTLTGGLLLSHLRGYFDKASYVEFRMGGHSTLFYEEALARLRFSDSWRAGYNAGVDVAIATGRHVALTAGVRLLSSPARTAVVAEILNADQLIFEVPLTRVQEHIATQPAVFSQTGTLVFAIGLRVR